MAVGLMIAAGRRYHEGLLKIQKYVFYSVKYRAKSNFPIIAFSSQWLSHPQFLLGQDITDATIGIVGLGNIGQTIAKRLQGFDIGQILYTSRKPKPEAESKFKAKHVTLDELVEKSDYVVISVPLANETRGLFNSELFKKMKPTSVLGIMDLKF